MSLKKIKILKVIRKIGKYLKIKKHPRKKWNFWLDDRVIWRKHFELDLSCCKIQNGMLYKKKNQILITQVMIYRKYPTMLIL